MKMKITIPFKTPTINHLYWHRGNIKIMKKEAKELREEIERLVDKEIYNCEADYLRDKELQVTVEIYEVWHNLDGSIKKKDISNREKFLIDSVFDALGLNDKCIFDNRFIKKGDEEEEKAIITIREAINERV